jgi:hypothetical protein
MVEDPRPISTSAAAKRDRSEEARATISACDPIEARREALMRLVDGVSETAPT